MLRDDYGDVSLILSAKQCPVCGSQLVQLGEKKPPLPLQIVAAIRDADLTQAALSELRSAVEQASRDTSPRELATQVPAASKIFNVASKAGENWIGLLALVLATIGMYVAHMDAQQAHHDAQEAIGQAREESERARRDAKREGEQIPRSQKSTGALSNEDVDKIVEQVEAKLEQD